MSVRDIIPWGRSSDQAPSLHRGGMDPFLSLHRNVNRLFDDVLRGFDMPWAFDRLAPVGNNWPSVEISETDKEIRVVAEVPGLAEKDIEVMLEEGVLTLRGEKKSEIEDKDRQFRERFYGRFERRIALGREVEENNVSATFKNGVLTVTAPKSEKARTSAKRIAISGSND
jgi:HSP20 family protein